MQLVSGRGSDEALRVQGGRFLSAEGRDATGTLLSRRLTVLRAAAFFVLLWVAGCGGCTAVEVFVVRSGRKSQ